MLNNADWLWQPSENELTPNINEFQVCNHLKSLGWAMTIDDAIVRNAYWTQGCQVSL